MKKLILIAFVCSALFSSAAGYFGIKPIVNEPNCYGSTNGSIQLSMVGGTGPYQYAWSGGLPSSIVQNNIGAGSYSVTVTDANNLTTSYTIIVAQPFQIQITETHNAPSTHGANNGAIATTTDGGSPSYTYLWSNGATTPNISGLAAGTYTLTVTDEVGCTATVSQTLIQPNAPFFNGRPSAPDEARSLNVSDNSTSNSNQAANSNELKVEGSSLKTSDVELFPNPTSNVVTLKTGEVNSSEISIIDINGQIVSTQKAETNETNLNVSGLQKGNYIVEVKGADGSIVNKTMTVVR